MRLVRIDPKVRPRKSDGMKFKVAGMTLLLFGAFTFRIIDTAESNLSTQPIAVESTIIVPESSPRPIAPSLISRGGTRIVEAYNDSVQEDVIVKSEPSKAQVVNTPIVKPVEEMIAGTKMTKSTFNKLDAVAKTLGLPTNVWFPIAMYESQGDPRCDTGALKSEHSHGIFQVNMYSHPDADAQKLFDPTYNAKYQMPELFNTYKQGKAEGVTGVNLTIYVSKYGQRPSWSKNNSSYIINTINKYYKLCP